MSALNLRKKREEGAGLQESRSHVRCLFVRQDVPDRVGDPPRPPCAPDPADPAPLGGLGLRVVDGVHIRVGGVHHRVASLHRVHVREKEIVI